MVGERYYSGNVQHRAYLAVRISTPEIIKGQIDAIFTDIEVSAVKIGMVSQIPTIHAIADKLEQHSLRML